MQNLEHNILALADQCVKCGMCLPSCPTNKLTSLEGQSPRGRIALWQSIAKQQLPPTEKTIEYLSQCLSCGACENNCPAGVKFLELQDLGKSYLLNNRINANRRAKATQPLKSKPLAQYHSLIIKTLSSKYLNKLARFGLYFYQRLNLKFLPILNTLATIPYPQAYHSTVKKMADSSRRKNVLLFTGCVNNIINQQTIVQIISLLEKLGINAYISDSLTCCAALYSHNGELDKANKIINHNQNTVAKLLQNNQIAHVLTIDTGCHTQIAKQFAEQDNPDFVLNIEQFIYHSVKNNPESLKLINDKIHNNIYIYTPCSQREQLKLPNITRELLQLALPNSTIKTLSKGYGCCGAAGRYMLDQPQMAEKLAKQILDDFTTENNVTDNINEIVLCTSNIGCALHLQQNLFKYYNIKLQTAHPLAVLAQYL